MTRTTGSNIKNKSPSPKSRTKSPLSGRQISVLLSLSIALLVSISGLGFAIAQSVLLVVASPNNYNAITGSPAPTTFTPLPPTPTPSSSTTFTASPPPPTLTPTFILPTSEGQALSIPTSTMTFTPAPSLTPFSSYRRTVIGYSVEGRPIEMHRFGVGQRRRLIVAGIHGGSEWNTTALAYELIAYLEENPTTIPEEVTLYILPSLNPDGEARAHSADGRVNANGVDLNRNWDADWKAAWPRYGCWRLLPTTAGPYPGSEPETQVLMNFLLSHRIDALVSYHSAALGIFPSGKPSHPDSVRLAMEIAQVSPYLYPPYDTGCQYSGALIDWALKQGIIGVDVELRTHTDTEFDINLRILSVLLNWQP